MKALTNSDLRSFVGAEGWHVTQSAPGGDGTRFTLRLVTGEMLSTTVPAGDGGIHEPRLVKAILAEQLAVTELAFRRCVDDGILPPRPEPARPSVPSSGVDAGLVRNLIGRAGLSQSRVAAMSATQAQEAWDAFLADAPERPAHATAATDAAEAVPSPR